MWFFLHLVLGDVYEKITWNWLRTFVWKNKRITLKKYFVNLHYSRFSKVFEKQGLLYQKKRKTLLFQTSLQMKIEIGQQKTLLNQETLLFECYKNRELTVLQIISENVDFTEIVHCKLFSRNISVISQVREKNHFPTLSHTKPFSFKSILLLLGFNFDFM